MGQPWDRQEGEPENCYTWFCCYLSLHPRERSVNAGYRAWMTELRDTYASSRLKGASPEWRKAARDWNWTARALAFDKHNYQAAGVAAIVNTGRYLSKLVDKALSKIDDAEGPVTWDDVLKSGRDFIIYHSEEAKRSFLGDSPGSGRHPASPTPGG